MTRFLCPFFQCKPTNAPAQAGYSLSTRAGAYVVVPYTPSLNVTNNNITVECWFNCVAPPSGGDQWDSLVCNEAYTTSFSGWDLRFGHLSSLRILFGKSIFARSGSCGNDNKSVASLRNGV